MVKAQRANLKPFYYALGVIALIGIALIWRTAGHAGQPIDIKDIKPTPAKAEGYLLGNPNAPVQVMEFADFECPACGQFATITEPDVRKNIIATGLANYRFFDFPLVEVHRNTLQASIAAACANDQGKFWEMHDKLYYGQPDWNTEATNDPKRFFVQYAKEIGLDMNAWTTCFDAHKHLERIMSNRAEGERRGVTSTPTFVIGTKQIAGALPYDVFKAYVDSAAAQAAIARGKAADSAGASARK